MNIRRWAGVVRMRAPNMFDEAVQTNKTSPIKHENKIKCFKLFDRMFEGLQILSNTIKQHQIMFDGVLVAKHFPFGQALINAIVEAPEVHTTLQ